MRTYGLPCRVNGCHGLTAPGSARGYCITHYWRWRRHGLCEAARHCPRPAISHIGLCDIHTPEGILP